MTDIKVLNDNFRKTFAGGRVIWTAGIDAMDFIDVVKIMEKSDILTISHLIMTRMASMILAVLIIKVIKSFGKLIIMTQTINIYLKILLIQMLQTES